MQFLKTYFSSRSTIYNLALSLFIFYGVAFLNWNPARIIAFYWVDVCVLLFFFLIYMKWTGRLLWYFEIAWGYFVIMMLMLGFLIIILSLADILRFNLNPINPTCKKCGDIYDKLEALFYPYFDFSVFISLSAMANFHLIKKIRALNAGEPAIYFFLHYAMYSVVSIPLFLCGSFFVSLLPFFNLRTSSILNCLFFRFLLDYWQQQNIRRIMPAHNIPQVAGQADSA